MTIIDDITKWKQLKAEATRPGTWTNPPVVEYQGDTGLVDLLNHVVEITPRLVTEVERLQRELDAANGLLRAMHGEPR